MAYAITERQEEALEIYERVGTFSVGSQEMGISIQVFTRLVHKAKRYLTIRDGAEPGFTVKGKSTLLDADGQVKLVWVKTDREKEKEIEDMIDGIIEGINKEIPRIKRTKKPKLAKIAADRLNGFIFGDSHINMLAWHKECPQGDWDINIALKQHLNAMIDLIFRAPPAKRAFLATMGDLLHHDSIKPLTTEGTMVDTDGRLGKGYDTVIAMIRGMLDYMLTIYEHVDYICVRGNHSKTLELIIAKTIAIAYEKEPRLTVIDNTCEHMLLEWEKNCLVFTHGDKLNDQKKADIVTSLFKKAHGRANASHLLSGHVHHESQKRVSGVLVETFAALPVPDSWHTAAGFITSDQSAVVLSYHKQGGITERITHFPRILIEE